MYKVMTNVTTKWQQLIIILYLIDRLFFGIVLKLNNKFKLHKTLVIREVNMQIILKFILKNIKEKKLRTLLIVVSITASAALFFAANGIANTFKDTFVNLSKSYYGSAEIEVSASDKSPSPYFLTDKAEIYSSKFDYIVGEMQTSGTYNRNKNESIPISFTGVNYDDIMTMNPLQFDSKLDDIKPFSGNKLIISKKRADKYNLRLGSRIKIRIKDNNEYFTIVGIAKNEGIFKTESDKSSIRAIIPKETAAMYNDERGKVSDILIKTKNSSEKDELIKKLSEGYKDYSVQETINMKEINESTSSINTAFMAMLVIVLTMSVFIIYTVFKVIIVERLPIIGTFRSIGATRATTDFVLIAESIIYGIIGGVFGDILGIGIIKIFAFIISKSYGGMEISVSYSVSTFIASFIFAIVVSFVSAIAPILKASRLSVKDVVLNTVDTVEKTKLWKLILGIVIAATALLIPKLVSKNIALPADMGCMLLGIIAVVILVPYCTQVLSFILEKAYGLIFKNEGILAAKNLRSNKNIINNISLLSIGISALFMLNVVSYSMGIELVKAYEVCTCDIYMSGSQEPLNRQILNKVKAAEGVDDTYGCYIASMVEVPGNKTKINEIYGYNSNGFGNFMNINYVQDKKIILNNFDENRNIILNETIRKSMNKNIGDIITLKTSLGNRDYKIVGSFSSLMDNGNMGIVPEKYLKLDFKLTNYSSIFIKTNKNPNVVNNMLKNKTFKGSKFYIDTWKNLEEENKKQIDQMLAIIKVFPIVSLFIGAFGVLNNFIISFMERKRYLAVFASVGMSKVQTVKMLFVEALSVGIIGAVMGITGGLIFTYIVPYLLDAADLPMSMYYQPQLFGTCFILGIMITIISSIIPSFKSSKLNVIEAIKYE